MGQVKDQTIADVDVGLTPQLPTSKVVWSTGRNIRFTPGYASKTLGKTYIAAAPGAIPIRDMFTFIGTDDVARTIVCCDSQVFSFNYDFSSSSDITPASAPTGGASDVWQFALVAGLPILTNGKDAIWKWPNYAGILAPLSGAPTFAKRISSVLHRLVVSNIGEGGYAYTGRTRWSEPGNPENWTIGTDGKSGYFDIVDYNTIASALANIIAQVTHGERIFYFTERGLWSSDFSQATKQFLLIDQEAEIMGPRAACRFKGHVYFIGKRDIHRISGQLTEDIGLPIRDELFDNVNPNALSAAIAFPMISTSEVWFCVPTGSNTVPDTAFVYNEELKNWSILDVNFSCHADKGLAEIPVEIVGNASGDILRLDYGDNDYSASAYRTIDGRIESGDMHFDQPNRMKHVAEIIPDLNVQATVCELLVQVGVRNRLADDIKWSDPVAFTIGSSAKCDFDGFRKEGKFVRVRFYSNQKDTPWSLSGYTIKYELKGER